MNKKLLILAAAVSALSFASCKKDYTCTCNYSLNGQNFGTATTTLENQSKSDAEAACPDNSTQSYNGVSATATCSLDQK